MSALTPFGIEIRKLRLEKGLRLADMGITVGRNPAFLSAVETGRKPIPDGFVTLIAQRLNLEAAEIKALRLAADRTRKEVRVEKLSGKDRELVAAFARRLDDVPESLLTAVRKVVMESIDGEIPFKRKRRGLVVPPMSTSALRAFAEKIRSLFVDDAQIEFPIIDVLEFKLPKILPHYYLDIQDSTLMGMDEGRVMPGSDVLILREDVYMKACNGDGRARFTAGHELLHYLIHRDIAFARSREDSDKIYCDAEWQADTFSGTLFMSGRHLSKFKDSEHAARLCNISGHAAHVMWTKYKAENYKA